MDWWRERKIMATDIHKETMVSFLVPTPILETIEDIRSFEGHASRSSIIRSLVNRGLKKLGAVLDN
jgi:hypothetical protein